MEPKLKLQLLASIVMTEKTMYATFSSSVHFKNPVFVLFVCVCMCCKLSGAATPDSSTFCSLETSMKKINLSADRYLSLKAWDLALSQIIIGPFGNKSSNAQDFYVHVNGFH